MTDPNSQPLPPTPQPPPHKRHWLAWLLVLLVSVALCLPLLHKSAPTGPMGPGGPGGGPNTGTSVTVAKVETGSMDVFLEALGTVTPQQTVNVYSQVSGRVLSVNYREGQIVQKGQSLVDVDPLPLQAQLQQSQGSLTRDQAALDQARINSKRYQDAYEQKAVSEQTVFDQQATVRQDEGTVQNDQGSVNYYKVQLGYCHITAPLTGRIGLRLIDPGNVIFSGSSSTIATITQLNPITTVFSLAEDHLNQIQRQLATRKTGLIVELYDRSQQNKLATGKLLTFDNQVDTSTGTVRLRALFDNTANILFPNQFVNARLQVDRLEGARLIPTVAIQYNGQQAFVYTVLANSTAKLQKITVINSEQDRSAIDGLNPGDTVVTSNFDRIQDGAAVSLPSARPAGGQMMGPAR
jgi:multidrug efflux system membrane fusion protein